ncbi:MAG: type III-A CRISPR-associated protein Csm2 [Candidatus Contendobacter sp.]|nr:MAG: type III-A CRISPR-associated protein Csm2 [Candidatus Contendobacter sp.]
MQDHHGKSNQPSKFSGGKKPFPKQDEPTLVTSKIVFTKPLNPDLFNGVARQVAETIAENRNTNKPSQIRKFYDELCLWETKVNQDPQKSEACFAEYLPFILMLNAKVAYAHGRKPMLVDANFVKLIGHCLQQVEKPETLRICKIFFEAFLGFYKELRPSDK